MWCRGLKSGILKTTIGDMCRRDSLRGWGSLRSSTGICLRPRFRNDRHGVHWLRRGCIVAMLLYIAFLLSYPLMIRLFLRIERRNDRALAWGILHLRHILAFAVPFMYGNPRPLSRKPIRLRQIFGLQSSTLVRRAFRCLNSWMTYCRLSLTAHRRRELRDRCIND